MLNKSLITNLLAIILLIAGYVLHNHYLWYTGIFAFSGAITNWLAVHMLFEKVPGLYGSGVIPARFTEFKIAIKQLMMAQFFTPENIERFLNQKSALPTQINLPAVIEKIDFNPSFDTLIEVVAQSSFGGMLSMFGGTDALLPLKQPFVEKMQASMIEISQSEAVVEALKSQLGSGSIKQDITKNIEEIIDQRLEELTPLLVKQMVQTMIKEHLGWLVVWGGVFGGIIGLICTFIGI